MPNLVIIYCTLGINWCKQHNREYNFNQCYENLLLATIKNRSNFLNNRILYFPDCQVLSAFFRNTATLCKHCIHIFLNTNMIIWFFLYWRLHLWLEVSVSLWVYGLTFAHIYIFKKYPKSMSKISFDLSCCIQQQNSSLGLGLGS